MFQNIYLSVYLSSFENNTTYLCILQQEVEKGSQILFIPSRADDKLSRVVLKHYKHVFNEYSITSLNYFYTYD